MVNRDFKKLRNKAFFMIGCKHTGEIEYDLTKTKKFSLIRPLVVVALKKKIQVWKIAESFFKNSIVRTLSFAQGISIHKVARAHPRSESYFGSHRGWILFLLLSRSG